MIISVLLIIILAIVCCWTLAGGFVYYSYLNKPEENVYKYKKFFCDKKFQYCHKVPQILDQVDTAKLPATLRPSKWIRYSHSCIECQGSFYYSFGTVALGDCILRLQIAKSPEDVDSALEILSNSIQESCKTTLVKNRQSSTCNFYANSNGTVGESTLRDLYGIIGTAIASKIPSLVQKTWLEKYSPMMTTDKIQDVDPFLVILYLNLETRVNKKTKYTVDLLDPKTDDCLPTLKMEDCKK